MKRIIAPVITFVLSIGTACNAQGTISRPPKQDKQSTHSTASRKSKASTQLKVSDPDGFINGHGYIDLGLPSGTKWATCNVGAASPEGYGDYFAWGETSMKEEYNNANSFSQSKSIETLKILNIIDESGELTQLYDAASINFGKPWRMPTEKEFTELRYKSKWTWATVKDINGYIVTGPNGKSIFLPAAGWATTNLIFSLNTCGDYWCSTVDEENNCAYQMGFDSQWPIVSWNNRSRGYSVRPVLE